MMRTINASVACLLVSLLTGCGSPQPEPPTEPAPDTSQVEGLERQMLEDFQNRDFDSMLNRMTADVVILGPDGIIDRAVWQAQMSQLVCEFDAPIEPEDIAVNVLAPSVVLVTSRATPVGTCDGAPLGPEISSSIWVWEDGEWRAAAHHFTPLPPESDQ